MARIDFHVLEEASPQAYLNYVCRLTEKAYTQGCHIHIHTADQDMTEQLDELLWVFRDRSFIPHQSSCTQQELCAVTLKHRALFWPAFTTVLTWLTLPLQSTELIAGAESHCLA